MKRIEAALVAAAQVGLVLTLAGCSAAIRAPGAGNPPADSPAGRAKADGGIPPYTQADVRFMQGMIGHHAQAVTMAALAPNNGAGSDIRILAARIAVAQTDEIAFMQRWLGKRKQTVPDPASAMSAHGGMSMPGMDMSKMDMSGTRMMPGMLTPAQMSELSSARGAEFDRQFLRYMIQHHQGALVMLDDLFGSRGAGQDDAVFKFASDVSADQSTEIARMELMLTTRAKRSNPQ